MARRSFSKPGNRTIEEPRSCPDRKKIPRPLKSKIRLEYHAPSSAVSR